MRTLAEIRENLLTLLRWGSVVNSNMQRLFDRLRTVERAIRELADAGEAMTEWAAEIERRVDVLETPPERRPN